MKNISYSEVKVYDECPWKHKILYKDKFQKKKTQYLAFGLAFHSTIEEIHKNSECEPVSFFEKRLVEEFLLISDETVFKKKTREQEFSEMLQQGKRLVLEIIPELNKHFPNYKFIACEEKLEIPLSLELSEPYQFKGYIDFILEMEDGTIAIVDFKTSSGGWAPQQKTDKLTTYQLVLYKKFYCEKYNLDPKNVVIYFAIIKRAVKKDSFDIFEVGCGPKKISNCIEFLDEKLKMIDKKILFKNYKSCHKKVGFFTNECEFYKTEYCQ